MSLGTMTKTNSTINSMAGFMPGKYLLEVIFFCIVEALFSMFNFLTLSGNQ